MLPERESKEFREYLNEIGRENKPKRHDFYEDSEEFAERMGVHVTGDDPHDLLNVKRPNEPEEAKKYRLATYKPKTKASANRVISVINRIYNERLFSIEYKDEPGGISPENGLKVYLTENLPLYVSLFNYIKSVFTKMHMKDANGLLAVYPLTQKDDTEYPEPVPVFYQSKNLVDFEDDEYYTLLFTKKDEYRKEQKLIIFTKVGIEVYHRDNISDDFELKEEKSYTHNFGFPCAFRVGGVVAKTEPPQLFESFISGVLPHWDDAVCMYSDLQASIVNHLYPEKWEYTTECDSCAGGGKVSAKDYKGDDCEINCNVCGGSGKVTSKGPFNVYQINREALNPDAPLPVPPFGYGDKELGSTELLEQLAEKEIQKGYAAINMDILNNVGADQSGIAKTIDRQDLDGFLEVYASHMFQYIIPNMIYLITLWRYGQVTDVDEYMPAIKAPTTFDVYSISLLTEEYSQLKESGVKGSFLLGVQKDIIEKRFSDEQTKAFYKAIVDVDPLAGLDNDEILSMSRVIGDTELRIHAFAKDLVEEAISENKDFLSLELKEKKEKIRQLAESRKQPIIEAAPNELNPG